MFNLALIISVSSLVSFWWTIWVISLFLFFFPFCFLQVRSLSLSLHHPLYPLSAGLASPRFLVLLQVFLRRSLVELITTVSSWILKPLFLHWLTARLVLGCIILSTLRFLRIQVWSLFVSKFLFNSMLRFPLSDYMSLELGHFSCFLMPVFPLWQIRKKFGYQVESFFVLLTALQFHLLFYCTRPLPNILALGLGDYFYSSDSTSSGPSDVLPIFPMVHLA